MNIKSLLLGSAAALVAVSGARAADAIVAAEPEPVEYVRVCDAFGTGFFYIPGTETCLRIHGYVRYDVGVGDLFAVTSNTGDETYFKRARASFRVSTASETELGTLRTYVETRWQWDTNEVSNFVNTGNNFVRVENGYSNNNEFSINFAWIQLGGLRVGKDESMFTTFTGYAGSVINDGNYGPFDTNLISYTYNGGAWRAAIALEQGDDSVVGPSLSIPGLVVTNTSVGWGIDDYVPHVVVGLGGSFGMVDLSAVVGWDSRDDYAFGGTTFLRGGFAGKLRADVRFNDAASVFAMLMYGENSSAYTTWANGAGANEETFSVIAGGSYRFNEKAAFNIQGQWIDGGPASDTWEAVANVQYDLVPGLRLTPEVVYTDNGANDEFGGYFRVERSF